MQQQQSKSLDKILRGTFPRGQVEHRYPAATSANIDEDDEEDPLGDFVPLADGLVGSTRNHNATSVEVMPAHDVNRVRIHLKQSFLGIPEALIKTGSPHQQKKKVDKTHPHYVLASGMMLGIRESVGGVDGLREIEVESHHDMKKECRMNRKYVFPDGTKFKAYAPLVFARIRSDIMGISKNYFLHSVCGNFKYSAFSSNAKSGSFFFFSHDGRYLIKTLTMEECHFLVRILPKYYQYILNNPQSLLTRFYGLYRLVSEGRTYYFCILRSVFSNSVQLTRTYDLKGSTLGRQARPHESVKKDLDLMAEGRRLDLSPEVAATLTRQLHRDAGLMARLGIMDYSLLLGVVDKNGEEDDDDDDMLPNESENLLPWGTFAALGEENRARNLDPNVQDRDEDEAEDEEDLGDILEKEAASGQFHEEDEYVCIDDDSTIGNPDEDPWLLSLCCGGLDPCDGMLPGFSLFSTPAADETQLNGVAVRGSALTDRPDGGIVSRDGKVIYYAGIIDILQTYNTLKWGETVWKQAQGNPAQTISSVDPQRYAQRFLQFLTSLLRTQDEEPTV